MEKSCISWYKHQNEFSMPQNIPFDTKIIKIGWIDTNLWGISLSRARDGGHLEKWPPFWIFRWLVGQICLVYLMKSSRQFWCLYHHLHDYVAYLHLSAQLIDKYLDIFLANQTARNASPPIIPKVALARRRTARVIISLTCPTNHSEADRRR